MNAVSSGLFVNIRASWQFTSHLAWGQHLPGRLSWNWNSVFFTSCKESCRRGKSVWQFESWDIRVRTEVSDLRTIRQGERTTSTWKIFQTENLFRNNPAIWQSSSDRGIFTSGRIRKSSTFSTTTRLPLEESSCFGKSRVTDQLFRGELLDRSYSGITEFFQNKSLFSGISQIFRQKWLSRNIWLIPE
jgi:hypothetical protein